MEGAILPAVSRAVIPQPPNEDSSSLSGFGNRSTLSSSSGVVVAVNNESSPQPAHATPQFASSSAGLPFDEEAKLVYGVVFSLRNMVKKLSGR